MSHGPRESCQNVRAHFLPNLSAFRTDEGGTKAIFMKQDGCSYPGRMVPRGCLVSMMTLPIDNFDVSDLAHLKAQTLDEIIVRHTDARMTSLSKNANGTMSVLPR